MTLEARTAVCCRIAILATVAALAGGLLADDGQAAKQPPAYDIAAYVNSQDRPRTEGLEDDYPDRSKKPVDCPYPPYADDFPRQQHKYGPFQPIIEAREN